MKVVQQISFGNQSPLIMKNNSFNKTTHGNKENIEQPQKASSNTGNKTQLLIYFLTAGMFEYFMSGSKKTIPNLVRDSILLGMTFLGLGSVLKSSVITKNKPKNQEDKYFVDSTKKALAIGGFVGTGLGVVSKIGEKIVNHSKIASNITKNKISTGSVVISGISGALFVAGCNLLVMMIRPSTPQSKANLKK